MSKHLKIIKTTRVAEITGLFIGDSFSYNGTGGVITNVFGFVSDGLLHWNFMVGKEKTIFIFKLTKA